MKILGVDPGLLNLGCVLTEVNKGKCEILESITLKTKSIDSLAQRLYQLFNSFKNLIERCRPDLIAVEEPLAKTNAYTTAKVFQAQAIVLILAEEHGIPIKIYHPSYWKNFLCGNGRASKAEVLAFLRNILGEENLKSKIQDEHMSDALGLALVCALEMNIF